MPERKEVRSGIFYFIRILSPSKSIRTISFSQYSLGSTAVLLGKYQSTDREVLTQLPIVA